MLGHPVYSPWKGIQNVDSAKPFINALRQGRLVLQVCSDCNRTATPGRLHCEHCRSSSLVWRKAAGTGRLIGITTYYRQYDHEYERKVPYNIALVRLDSGALMLGMIDGTGDQSQVGCRVQLDLLASAKGMPLKFVRSQKAAP